MKKSLTIKAVGTPTVGTRPATYVVNPFQRLAEAELERSERASNVRKLRRRAKAALAEGLKAESKFLTGVVDMLARDDKKIADLRSALYPLTKALLLVDIAMKRVTVDQATASVRGANQDL